MMKSLIVLVISLCDSTMTIDSHNYHFILDYCLQMSKCLNTAHEYKEYSDIVLNVIDAIV